ncbi:nucleotidyl transferase AbiEii/AbiGii toxin family protein [Dysgonomonas sp. HDW5B]|uniref:nucleotidyl transferase AbiEii/AbiGii toxin family protein n=1 Tax=Dysgonomonas sp. HDW5B TaxID=2714927 RepID=UPI00140E24E2|nr:nucleotidyl transferase AbiEii/AbiGii toxin family protein [Dysgonomonas sp. HDW5B]QIK53132.1 nucleotidyl transferase AbiEii/AbiGii toxin family protein [Dysgonomonas sp. HDW5B]
MRSNNLHTETVSRTLLDVLNKLMKLKILAPFRLVGGTALSLQLGHRMSVDIDLFTDAEYDSIDFHAIDKKLQETFPFLEMQYAGNDSFGKSYYIGKNKDDLVKVDLFYTDSFIRPIIDIDSIRMATIEEISAMKMEVIGQNGRKKDFWDVHELMEHLSLEQMMRLHAERYPYSHTQKELKEKLIDFQYADADFDPKCLKGKYWELIKEDIIEMVDNR